MVCVAVAGIATVLLALLFRQERPELAMLLSLACCVVCVVKDTGDYGIHKTSGRFCAYRYPLYGCDFKNDWNHLSF